MLVTIGALRVHDTGMELQWSTCGCCVQLTGLISRHVQSTKSDNR